MDKTSFISSLETFVREVHKETDDAQIASIARVFARYEAPVMIDEIKEELRNRGKTA